MCNQKKIEPKNQGFRTKPQVVAMEAKKPRKNGNLMEKMPDFPQGLVWLAETSQEFVETSRKQHQKNGQEIAQKIIEHNIFTQFTKILDTSLPLWHTKYLLMRGSATYINLICCLYSIIHRSRRDEEAPLSQGMYLLIIELSHLNLITAL